MCVAYEYIRGFNEHQVYSVIYNIIYNAILLSRLEPIVLQTSLSIVSAGWNHDGSLLALAGVLMNTQEKDVNVVQFYSPFGEVELFLC